MFELLICGGTVWIDGSHGRTVINHLGNKNWLIISQRRAGRIVSLYWPVKPINKYRLLISYKLAD